MSRRRPYEPNCLPTNMCRIGIMWTAGVVATDDQSRLAIFRVGGRYLETADHDETDAAHNRLNVLARNIASDRLILSVHLVRRAATADDYPAGTFRSAFAQRLDEAYRGSVLRQLYRNDMFLSVFGFRRLWRVTVDVLVVAQAQGPGRNTGGSPAAPGGNLPHPAGRSGGLRL